MTKDELRKECSRLFLCNTINDSYDLIDIYSEYLFQVIINHQHDKVKSKADHEATLVNQMMLSKVLHLKKIVLGIDYTGKDGTRLNRIIDPTINASIIRNIYETVCMFNLIYINTKSEDEKTILYNLWVHSGLKYRQKFESIIASPENQKKLLQEKTRIDQLIEQIEQTALYKSLEERDKEKIKAKLKEKDYKIQFQGKEVVFCNWQELTKVIGIKEGLLDQSYTYYSFYSHPSNVAVFQFADMFKNSEKAFLKLTQANLTDFFFLISIFVADYVKLFPDVLKTFNRLSIRDQIVINFGNTFVRGHEYSINDSLKELD